MRLSFMRQGFACNSSSTHSLVILKDTPDDVDIEEFGWNMFVAGSVWARKLYLITCLNYSWRSLADLKCTYGGDVDRDEVSRLEASQFAKWAHSALPGSCADAVDHVVGSYTCVDHQSLIWFPRYRREPKINREFACALISAICAGPFAILGGNDNEEADHPLRYLDSAGEGVAVKALWRMLKDRYRHPMAEYDQAAKEFVVSLPDRGDLMRVEL